MSSENNTENETGKLGNLTISAQTGEIAETRVIESLEQLFAVAAGNNFSALSHDMDADGWPDIGDLDDPLVREAIDSFQTAYLVDQPPVDSRDIARYAIHVLHNIEDVYSKFNANSSPFIGQIENSTDKAREESIALDQGELMRELEPYFVTEEDLELSVWDKLWGKKAEEKPSPRTILSHIEQTSMTLNTHQAQVERAQYNAERNIRSIRAQKESLLRSLEEAQRVNVELVVAYHAGMEILREWHSMEVKEAYINCPEFSKPKPSRIPDTTFFLPPSPAAWCEATFQLNQRMEHIRSTFLKFQEIQRTAPANMQLIDERIERFEASSKENREGWQKGIRQIRRALDLIRVEQRLEILKEQTIDLIKRRKKNAEFTEKFEANQAKKHKTPATLTQTVGQETPADRIRQASKDAKAKMDEEDEALTKRMNALSGARDELREELGMRPVSQSAQSTMPSLDQDNNKEPKKVKKNRWGLPGFGRKK